MDSPEVIRRRRRAQRLTGAPHPDPVAAVRWSGAVQAQELAEARWSIVQRVGGADDASVQAALDGGALVRTHVMRPTWHLVAAEDLRWIARLTAPRAQAANGSSYRREGLDAATLARTDALLLAALADGEPRTRPELGAALAAGGVPVPGQRLAHAVMHAELGCLIVSGPRRGHRHTYVQAEGRLTPAPDRPREEDLAELAWRFLRSHGPTSARDLAWWSSLTLADCRAAIAACGDAVAEVAPELWAVREAAGPPPPPPGGEPEVRLLGEFDELVVAHREHRPAPPAAEATPPPGERTRLVLCGDEVVGAWRRALGPRAVTVRVRRFRALEPAEEAALTGEVESFGAALGLPASLER